MQRVALVGWLVGVSFFYVRPAAEQQRKDIKTLRL